jgi:hypothetical protein
MLKPSVDVSPKRELTRCHKAADRHIQQQLASKPSESGTANSEKSREKSGKGRKNSQFIHCG